MKKLITLFLIALTTFSTAQLDEGLNFEEGINFFSELGQTEYITSSSFSDDGVYLFNSVRNGKVILSKYNGSEYVYQGVIINSPTTTIGERGLIRVKYHNGYLYLFRTAIPNEVFPTVETLNYLTINKIDRYKFIDEAAEFDSVVIGTDAEDGMLAIGETHNGGDIAFDDEGYMYTATGDGGNWTYKSIATARGLMSDEIADNGYRYISMSLETLNGKVLRVNPETGEGHPDNPFYDVDNPKSPQSRIYAMGFRNPWRLHFANGVLYVADVGAQARETIYAITHPGVSGAWSMWEGLTKKESVDGSAIHPDYGIPFNEFLQEPTSFDLAENPQDRQKTKYVNCFDYGRSTNTTRLPYFEDGALQTEEANFNTEGSSVIGGVLIQGNALGNDLEGKFLFMDSYRDWVGLASVGSGERHFEQINTIGNLGQNGFVHIEQSPLDGSLWFTTLFRRVWRMSYDNPLSIDDVEFDFDNETALYYHDISGRYIKKLRFPTGLFFATYEINGKEITVKELYKQGILINRRK